MILSCSSRKKMKPVIVIHGGSGDVSDLRMQGKLAGVTEAARAGSAVLLEGKSALDAVVAAVKIMEDDPYFNAGTGAVLNLNGQVEMDALIVDGKTLNAGSVTGVKGIQHPIELARLVMERSPHVMLAGQGANEFATLVGVQRIPEYKFVTSCEIEALEEFLHDQNGNFGHGSTNKSLPCGGVGTVGAVAVDSMGNVASATSTGGTTGKWPGRVGDSPLIGCGGYADNEVGAVSATGHGEAIMRVCLSHRIINNMESGKTAQEATEEALAYLNRKTTLTAGAITLSKQGDIGIFFNDDRMAWSYRKGSEEIQCGAEEHPNWKK